MTLKFGVQRINFEFGIFYEFYEREIFKSCEPSYGDLPERRHGHSQVDVLLSVEGSHASGC